MTTLAELAQKGAKDAKELFKKEPTETPIPVKNPRPPQQQTAPAVEPPQLPKELTPEKKVMYDAMYLGRWPTEQQKKDLGMEYMDSVNKRIDARPKKERKAPAKEELVGVEYAKDDPKRSRLIMHISRMWARFPECAAAHGSDAEKRKFLNKATLPMLEGEKRRCSEVRSGIGFIEPMLQHLIYDGGAAAEPYILRAVPKFSGCRGTMDKLATEGGLDDDIAELAIELAPYVSVGPILRIIATIMSTAMIQRVENAVAEQTAKAVQSGQIKLSGTVDKDKLSKFKL